MKNLKRLVNHQEQKALEQLDELGLVYGYKVYSKVRLADVLRIQKGSTAPLLFSFALRSHFDFIICDPDYNPLFAVEFDGPLHGKSQQRERDVKKDELCRIFELPLLRINANHLLKRYNKASLLRWIVSVWELQKEFCERQEAGIIPMDEDFDPFWFFHPGQTLEEVHPHCIALRPRLHIQKLYERGCILSSVTCGFKFRDSAGNYRGIEWIDVAESKIVAVENAMRRQQFPINFYDLFDEMMTLFLYDKLVDYLKTGKGASHPHEIESKVNTLKACCELAGCHSGGTCVNVSLSWKSEKGALDVKGTVPSRALLRDDDR